VSAAPGARSIECSNTNIEKPRGFSDPIRSQCHRPIIPAGYALRTRWHDEFPAQNSSDQDIDVPPQYRADLAPQRRVSTAS
jgi:hypothetical protein